MWLKDPGSFKIQPSGFGDEVPGMAIGELCLRLQGLTRPFHANVIHSRSGQQPFKDYMICFQCDLYGED